MWFVWDSGVGYVVDKEDGKSEVVGRDGMLEGTVELSLLGVSEGGVVHDGGMGGKLGVFASCCVMSYFVPVSIKLLS
jgi:hypothetical protein